MLLPRLMATVMARGLAFTITWATNIAAAAATAFVSRLLAETAVWPTSSYHAVHAIETELMEALDPCAQSPASSAGPASYPDNFPPSRPAPGPGFAESWASWFAGAKTVMCLWIAVRAWRGDA